jgi:hypothetical protein
MNSQRQGDGRRPSHACQGKMGNTSSIRPKIEKKRKIPRRSQIVDPDAMHEVKEEDTDADDGDTLVFEIELDMVMM